MRVGEALRSAARLLEESADFFEEAALEALAATLAERLGAGRPLLVCGNGGSAADAIHITGELVGRFKRDRRALKAICLVDNPGVITAWSNDIGYEDVFARQVEAFAEPGGVLVGLSTSGNSPNVVAAFERARALGLLTVAMTGEGGGRLAPLADHLLAVPSRDTPAIQQVHQALYHWLCERIEAAI